MGVLVKNGNLCVTSWSCTMNCSFPKLGMLLYVYIAEMAQMEASARGHLQNLASAFPVMWLGRVYSWWWCNPNYSRVGCMLARECDAAIKTTV